MRKKLTRHGNSLALVIDKPILELLNISDETLLDIATDGQSLFISPVNSAADEKKFEKALGELHKKYGRMMKRLAE